MDASEFLQNKKGKDSMITLLTVDLILEVKACMFLSFCRMKRRRVQ